MTLFRPIWTDVGLCFIYNSGETHLDATETGTFTLVDLMHFTEDVVPPYRPNRSCYMVPPYLILQSPLHHHLYYKNPSPCIHNIIM